MGEKFPSALRDRKSLFVYDMKERGEQKKRLTQWKPNSGRSMLPKIVVCNFRISRFKSYINNKKIQ